MTQDQVHAALEALLAACGEHRARLVLSAIGRPSAQAEFERLVAMRLAARMLQERAGRPDVRERLMQQGLSRRSAYRLIGEALNEGWRNCASEGSELARADGQLTAPQPQQD